MTPVRLLTTISLCALAAGSLSACSVSNVVATSAAAAQAPQPGAPMPLHEHLLRPAYMTAHSAHVSAATAECLSAAGISVPPVPDASDVIEAELAAGFEMSPDAARDAEPQAVDFEGWWTDADTAAGPENAGVMEGCADSAVAGLESPEDTELLDSERVPELIVQAYERAENAPNVQRAHTSWRECVRDAGVDAGLGVPEQLTPGSVDALVRARVSAGDWTNSDAESFDEAAESCAAEVDVEAERFAAEYAIQQELVAEHSEELKAIAAANARAEAAVGLPPRY